jgi:hypothetical protein
MPTDKERTFKHQKKTREEKLVNEMFSGVGLDEVGSKRVRNILSGFIDTYYELGCDEDEDE